MHTHHYDDITLLLDSNDPDSPEFMEYASGNFGVLFCSDMERLSFQVWRWKSCSGPSIDIDGD